MRPRDSNTSVSTRRSLSHSPQRQFKSLKEQDSFLQQDSSFSNSNAFSGDKENLSMSIPSKQILESPGIQNSATKKKKKRASMSRRVSFQADPTIHIFNKPSPEIPQRSVGGFENENQGVVASMKVSSSSSSIPQMEFLNSPAPPPTTSAKPNILSNITNQAKSPNRTEIKKRSVAAFVSNQSANLPPTQSSNNTTLTLGKGSIVAAPPMAPQFQQFSQQQSQQQQQSSSLPPLPSSNLSKMVVTAPASISNSIPNTPSIIPSNLLQNSILNNSTATPSVDLTSSLKLGNVSSILDSKFDSEMTMENTTMDLGKQMYAPKVSYEPITSTAYESRQSIDYNSNQNMDLNDVLENAPTTNQTTTMQQSRISMDGMYSARSSIGGYNSARPSLGVDMELSETPFAVKPTLQLSPFDSNNSQSNTSNSIFALTPNPNFTNESVLMRSKQNNQRDSMMIIDDTANLIQIPSRQEDREEIIPPTPSLSQVLKVDHRSLSRMNNETMNFPPQSPSITQIIRFAPPVAGRPSVDNMLFDESNSVNNETGMMTPSITKLLSQTQPQSEPQSEQKQSPQRSLQPILSRRSPQRSLQPILSRRSVNGDDMEITGAIPTDRILKQSTPGPIEGVLVDFLQEVPEVPGSAMKGGDTMQLTGVIPMDTITMKKSGELIPSLGDLLSSRQAESSDTRELTVPTLREVIQQVSNQNQAATDEFPTFPSIDRVNELPADYLPTPSRQNQVSKQSQIEQDSSMNEVTMGMSFGEVAFHADLKFAEILIPNQSRMSLIMPSATPFGLSEQIDSAFSSLPLLNLVQESCETLKQTTFSWNDAISQAERELEQENPIFLSLLTQNNFKSTELKEQLKQLRAKCRAEGKEDLFEWRSQSVSKFNSQLTENLDALKHDKQTLENLVSQIDQVLESMNESEMKRNESKTIFRNEKEKLQSNIALKQDITTILSGLEKWSLKSMNENEMMIHFRECWMLHIFMSGEQSKVSKYVWGLLPTSKLSFDEFTVRFFETCDIDGLLSQLKSTSQLQEILCEISLRLGRASDLLSDLNLVSKKLTLRKRIVGEKKETWISSEYTKLATRSKFLVDFKMDWSFNFAPVEWKLTKLFGCDDFETSLEDQVEECILTVDGQFDRLSLLCKRIDLL